MHDRMVDMVERMPRQQAGLKKQEAPRLGGVSEGDRELLARAPPLAGDGAIDD